MSHFPLFISNLSHLLRAKLSYINITKKNISSLDYVIVEYLHVNAHYSSVLSFLSFFSVETKPNSTTSSVLHQKTYYVEVKNVIEVKNVNINIMKRLSIFFLLCV
jgi:hypothetical protein